MSTQSSRTASRYVTDADGRIVEVDETWQVFARENGAPELAEQWYGLSIWSAMADDGTRSVLRHLVERAARGAPVWFTFRCDSPTLERWLVMRIAPARRPEGGFEFTSILLRDAPVDEPDGQGRASGDGHGHSVAGGPATPGALSELPPHIRICSWCERAHTGDGWVELDAYVRERNVFDGSGVPDVTHGLCPECSAVLAAGGGGR